MQETFNNSSIASEQSVNLTADILKANPPKHPALQRLSAKLNECLDTGNMISRYDRTHHRHNRS
jgi:hypothetical protein